MRNKVIGRDFRLHQTKIHSVLHCRNSDCSSMTVNRDVNASANMRDLLISEEHGAKRSWAFSGANKNPEDTFLKKSLGLSSGSDCRVGQMRRREGKPTHPAVLQFDITTLKAYTMDKRDSRITRGVSF